MNAYFLLLCIYTCTCLLLCLQGIRYCKNNWQQCSRKTGCFHWASADVCLWGDCWWDEIDRDYQHKAWKHQVPARLHTARQRGEFNRVSFVLSCEWNWRKRTFLPAALYIVPLVDGRLTGASLASHRELLRWRRLHRDMPLLWYNYTLSEPVQRRRSFVLVMFMSTDEVLFWCHLRHCVSYTAQNFLWSFVHSSGLNSVGYLDQDWVPEIVKP